MTDEYLKPDDGQNEPAEQAENEKAESVAGNDDASGSGWNFNPDDPDIFLQDPEFDPLDFSQHESEQDAALAGVVDEETLNAAIKLWFDDDRMFSVPIVDGLFFRGSIGAVYGASHSGKTLYTVALCDCISRGVPFGDLAVRPSPVLYLNAESKGDMVKRTVATIQQSGLEKNDNFRIIHSAFDVRQAKNRALLIHSLPKLFGEGHRPPVFVFDTLAQHFAGAEGEPIDENSARDVGQFIYGLRHLAESTGGCVIVVAHPGKDGDKGIRGSSALRAALDTELRIRSIRPEENSRKILIQSTLTKQRMCDAMEDACYSIKKIMVGSSDTGTEGLIDEDDVMVLPDRSPEQFTRTIAPSNQTAVMIPEPMPVPDVQENISGARKPAVQKMKPAKKLTEANLERAENIRRILNDNFQGEASRASINGIWRHEGFKAVELSAALSDAVSAGLIENAGDGYYKSTIAPSTVGKMGSPADKRNLPAEDF